MCENKLNPPDYLSDEEIAIWNKTLAQMEKLEVADEMLNEMNADILGVYCNAVVRYRKISRKDTKFLSNDDMKQLQGWSRIILSCADKLGLTPTTLARLKKKYYAKKKSAQQSAHPTLLESAPLEASSTPEHSATSQTDQTQQQRG